ncbi:preprotein translocase subunit SecG [Erythrobacter insulae]|uniref:Protein-export membrane protein SecG n=1 Tax=Erythrobacter insulae TaxID=2584124 RepID=A0A547PEJ5_9SPHN|nr:preprotein translocase subunit SecG [Erythrobacter insulae]TRD12573.1 preprotein translocase subunit SecG [Erythrobacter insulae]
MFLFLTVIQAIVAAGLVGVVLMQRSEGGGLGIGGNPNGALGARGAADFLTRATKWLAVAFVALSIALAAVAVSETSSNSITTTLDRDVSGPTTEDLLGGSGESETADPLGAAGDTPPTTTDAPAEGDPLSQ